jgi:hypothetical protein
MEYNERSELILPAGFSLLIESASGKWWVHLMVEGQAFFSEIIAEKQAYDREQARQAGEAIALEWIENNLVAPLAELAEKHPQV